MNKLLFLSGTVFFIFAAYARFGGNLKYFKPYEFGIWWPLMNPDVLTKLDAFREKWGAPVRISPHPDALGRHGGENSHSQHNVDMWGMVNAVDVFPEGMNSKAERQRAYKIAREVGFTGIGLYTDTKPHDMLHVDVRSDVKEGSPATWARVAGAYVGINAVV